MIVNMPDGTPVSFPDDMPRKQIKGLIASKYPQIMQDSRASPSMMQNIAGSGAERGRKLYDIINEQNGRGQSKGEKVLQIAGNEIGVLGDVLGAGISAGTKNIYSQLPENAQRYIENKAAPVLETISPYLRAYEENLQAYNKSNPRTGANLEAIRELGGLVSMAAAPEAVISATKGVGKAFRNVVGSPIDAALNIAKEAKVPVPKEAMIKAMARDSYKKAEEMGGSLKAEETNKFLDSISQLAPQSELGKIVGGDSPFTKELERFTGKKAVNEMGEEGIEGGIRNRPMTLQSAQELDEMLGDIVDSHTDNGRLTKQGLKIQKIQDALRDTIENADKNNIVGGKEGFEAWEKGRNEWATALRLRDIEKILRNAEATDNEATAIKGGFRTLMRNDKRFNRYNAAEKAAIKKAATDGIITGTLRTVLGSRLLAGVGGVAGGGLPGAIASVPVSMAARAAATKIKKGQANRVAREVGKRLSNKEIGKLPPREAIKLLENK